MKMLFLLFAMFFLLQDATAQYRTAKPTTLSKSTLVKAKKTSLDSKSELNDSKSENYALELSIPMMGNITIKEPSQELYNDTKIVHQRTDASELIHQFAKVKIATNELDLIFSSSYTVVALNMD